MSMMKAMEVESQQVVVVVETMTTKADAATAYARTRTTVALRLLAFAASLAAAVVVATNRQDRWGIVVTLKIDIRRLGVRTHVNQYGPVQSPRLLVNRWDLL